MTLHSALVQNSPDPQPLSAHTQARSNLHSVLDTRPLSLTAREVRRSTPRVRPALHACAARRKDARSWCAARTELVRRTYRVGAPHVELVRRTFGVRAPHVTATCVARIVLRERTWTLGHLVGPGHLVSRPFLARSEGGHFGSVWASFRLVGSRMGCVSVQNDDLRCWDGPWSACRVGPVFLE